MATEIASFYATIGADATGLKRGLEETKTAMGSLQTGFSQMQSFAETAIKATTLAVTAMGGAVAVTGLKFNAMKEQADIAFTTMLGSGLMAKSFLDELQAFAAKTPFEFPDLIRASQRLLAMGFAASEIIPTMTAIGDAVAALGGGQMEIDRVTTALGQMNAKGKTSAEEMMQLTEAGIPAWQMLADKIGVSVPEAMKMVTAGAIDAKTTVSAVVDGIETRFGGMMAAQSQTFNGLLSNLKDNFTQLSGTVMQPFFDMAKVGLKQVVEITSSPEFTAGVKEFAAWGTKLAAQFSSFIQSGIEWGQQVLPPLWEKLQQVVSVIREFIAPISNAIGKFVTWKDALVAIGLIAVSAMASIVASFAPLVATLLVVTAAVAALRTAWQNDFGGIRTITKNALEDITEWFYTQSGLWHGSWEETFEYFSWWVKSGWKLDIYFPLRSALIEAGWAFNEFKMKAVLIWNDFVTDTKNKVIEWKNKIVDKFGDFKNETTNTVNHWVGYILDRFDYYKGRAYTIFTLWKNTIVGIVVDWRDDMIRRFDNVLDWFKQNEWVQKGRDIVQGLWNGAKEIWANFKSWWDRIWGNDVPKTVDVKMKIGSPSKVMEDKAKDVFSGFIIGGEKMMPQLTAMMDGAMGGVSGYAYTGGGSTTSPDTALLQRNNQLLEVLIATLQNKNMSPTVNVQGGNGGLSSLVGFTAGLR